MAAMASSTRGCTPALLSLAKPRPEIIARHFILVLVGVREKKHYRRANHFPAPGIYPGSVSKANREGCMAVPKIVPCLWFDHQAEDAATFYTGLFKRSKMGMITRYGEGAPMPKGSILTVSF